LQTYLDVCNRFRAGIAAWQTKNIQAATALLMLVLVSLTIPFNIPPADERAGQQEKSLMDIRTALVADPQSAKSMKPPKGSFDDPAPVAKPFA
jgi:hypothetical protein